MSVNLLTDSQILPSRITKDIPLCIKQRGWESCDSAIAAVGDHRRFSPNRDQGGVDSGNQGAMVPGLFGKIVKDNLFSTLWPLGLFKKKLFVPPRR